MKQFVGVEWSLRVLLVVFGFLGLVGVAFAAAPAPVLAVVVDGGVTQYFSDPAGQFQSATNLAWRLSSSDPDQINGTLNYTLFQDQTAFATGWVPIYNVSHTAVPGRPGWVFTDASRADISANGSFIVHFNLTVTDDAQPDPNTSPASCLVGLEVAQSFGHDQCGSPIIAAPAGLVAIVNATLSSTGTPGNINLSWPVSASDVNLSVGNFSYRIVLSSALANGSLVVLRNFTDDVTASDTGGFRVNDVETAGAFSAVFMVRAEDPETHQWSNWTCAVVVRSDVLFDANGCGTLAGTRGALPAAGAPSFPLLNVPLFTLKMGITSDAAGWFLTGVFVLALVLAGFFIARGVGVLFGAVLGIAGSAAMALIPLWLLVIVFLIAAGVVVLIMSGGRE